MDSRLKPIALQIAGWGLLYGDPFGLYVVAKQLSISNELASAVVHYLRNLRYVEVVSESRGCKQEEGKHSSHRAFIKVIAIHPEPPRKVPPVKVDLLRSKLAACPNLCLRRGEPADACCVERAKLLSSHHPLRSVPAPGCKVDLAQPPGLILSMTCISASLRWGCSSPATGCPAA
jgi:hypothetical protein